MQKIIVFDQGEERHVRLQIHNVKGEPFSILKARFELVRGTEVEDYGDAQILDHVIDVLIAPEQIGIYKLKVTYWIGDETLIEVIRIEVNGS